MTDSKQPDDENYEEFLSRFTVNRDRIYAYVFSLVPRAADAEDVFQKCSLVLWRKFDQFRTDGDFVAWACGVARFEVLNYLKTSGRDRLCFNEELVQQLAARRVDTLPQYDEKLTALRGCMKELSITQCDLIGAAYGSDQSVKQLAESSGSAVQTLYNQLFKLRRQLLKCVQNKLAAS